MKPIKAKVDFTLNGRFYTAGNDVRVDRVDEAIKLNELGFIEPLTKNDIEEIRTYIEEEAKREYQQRIEESRKKEE
jgi:hypothetical protein